MSWEPFGVSLTQIAEGQEDGYIELFANQVRLLDLPLVICFGHEMNAGWYPWGARGNDAVSFVNAWRHVHGIFQRANATNVLWVWSPNVINPVPEVALEPLYPGDQYVDWIGIIGYFRKYDKPSFSALYLPTIKLVRSFTSLPIMIAETGVEPSPDKPAKVAELLDAVVRRADIIGLVYFNYNKEVDWRIESDSAALATFRDKISDPGFDLVAVR
jgi:beta-mannanase